VRWTKAAAHVAAVRLKKTAKMPVIKKLGTRVIAGQQA
jgi:hypothetical protein